MTWPAPFATSSATTNDFPGKGSDNAENNIEKRPTKSSTILLVSDTSGDNSELQNDNDAPPEELTPLLQTTPSSQYPSSSKNPLKHPRIRFIKKVRFTDDPYPSQRAIILKNLEQEISDLATQLAKFWKINKAVIPVSIVLTIIFLQVNSEWTFECNKSLNHHNSAWI